VQNGKWIKSPIDNFILARLEADGLQPAPRRIVAHSPASESRPSRLAAGPEDVEAFINDTAPGAYERYVDKLLESPRWGEHRGRYWLDLARYADSHGIHSTTFARSMRIATG